MRWGPYIDPIFYDIERLFDEIHKKLHEIREPAAREVDEMLESVQRKINSLGAEIHDAGDKYIILFELPGFKKEDIKVRAGHDFIQINAVRKAMEFEGTRISEKVIERRINLPEEIVPQKVKAKFNNGILEIIAPKAHKTNIVDVKVE